MYFVLIGDMINSRQQKNRKAVQEKFLHILEDFNVDYRDDLKTNLTITLGDEFQGLFRAGQNLIDFIVHFVYAMKPIDFRFGLGYGEITTNLNSSDTRALDGPAFYNAREALEIARKGKKTLIVKGLDEDEIFNLLSRIFFRQIFLLTEKQMTSVVLMLKQGSQKNLTDILSLSKSAVSQRLKSANWEELWAIRNWLAKQLASYLMGD